MTDAFGWPSPSHPAAVPEHVSASRTPVGPVPSCSTGPPRSENAYKLYGSHRARCPEDLSRINRQDWSRLHVDGPHHDGWYIAKIVLRAFSFILMITMVATYLIVIVMTQAAMLPNQVNQSSRSTVGGVADVGLNAAFGTFAVLTLMWDMAEFITLCCRKGYGITPKAHVGIELTLFIWGAATMSLMCLTTVYPAWANRSLNAHPGVEEITAVAVMGGLIVIIRFILFVRNAADKCGGRGLTPRIMYLQTGEPVVVMRKPYPPPPTRREPDIEMNDYATARPAEPVSALSLTSTLVTSSPRPAHRGVMTGWLRGETQAADATGRGPSPQPTGSTSPGAAESVVVSSPRQQEHPEPEQPQNQVQPLEEQQQQQQTRTRPSPAQPFPSRKPVPRPSRSSESGYSHPIPAPGYEPDEAERRRAERGERQAQWMTLEAMGIRGLPSGKRRGEGSGRMVGQEAGGEDLDHTASPGR